jgi:hypothetical protein
MNSYAFVKPDLLSNYNVDNLSQYIGTPRIIDPGCLGYQNTNDITNIKLLDYSFLIVCFFILIRIDDIMLGGDIPGQ